MIGKNIKQARKKMGLSQKELAQKMNESSPVSRQRINQIETSSDVSFSNVYAAFSAMGYRLYAISEDGEQVELTFH